MEKLPEKTRNLLESIFNNIEFHVGDIPDPDLVDILKGHLNNILETKDLSPDQRLLLTGMVHGDFHIISYQGPREVTIEIRPKQQSRYINLTVGIKRD